MEIIPPPHLFKTNIRLPPITKFSMWSLSFRFPDNRLYTFFISSLLISFSSILCSHYYPISLSDFQVAIFQEAFYKQLHNQAILTARILTIGIVNECFFIRNIHNSIISYKCDFFSSYYRHCIIIGFWKIFLASLILNYFGTWSRVVRQTDSNV